MAIPPITNDFLLIDGLEPVTVLLRNGSPTPTTYTEPNAHRNQARVTEHTPSKGDVLQGDTIWQLPINPAHLDIPLGSTLTDALNEVWTILRRHKQIFNSKWEFHCRNLSLQAGLDLTVVLSHATYIKDNYGEAIPHWGVLVADLAAKIQPLESEAATEPDRYVTNTRYQITLAQSLTILPGIDYRLTDQDGNSYNVLSYHQPERIDALPHIIAIRNPAYGSSSSGTL